MENNFRRAEILKKDLGVYAKRFPHFCFSEHIRLVEKEDRFIMIEYDHLSLPKEYDIEYEHGEIAIHPYVEYWVDNVDKSFESQATNDSITNDEKHRVIIQYDRVAPFHLDNSFWAKYIVCDGSSDCRMKQFLAPSKISESDFIIPNDSKTLNVKRRRASPERVPIQTCTQVCNSANRDSIDFMELIMKGNNI